MMFFLCIQLYAQNFIASVDSYDSVSPSDNDEVYSIGTRVSVVTKASEGRDNLTGSVSIASISTGYNSGSRTMENMGSGTYQYTWDTARLSPANDYAISITLIGTDGKETTDKSLTIELYGRDILLKSVDSHDSSNPDDNDELYHSGQTVTIVAEYFPGQITGVLEISSKSSGYNSQAQTMQKGTGNTMEYAWNTAGLQEANDYVVAVTLKDSAGHSVTDNSLVIKIDNTIPKIMSVLSNDRSDITDSDDTYHAGQTIVIDAQAANKEIGLVPTIQIKSDTVLYNSGVQGMTDQRNGSYRFIWTTTGLNEAKDYKAIVTFQDQAGNQSQDSSLVMEINNAPPQNGQVIVNNNDAYTLSSSVNLTISADGATKMYVFGDVVDDVSTFEWIPYVTDLKVKLNGKDGIKKVSVRFTNKAGNDSPPAEDTIILDEMPPVITSVSSYDESDKEDNDGIYHSGQSIAIIAQTDGSDLVKLEGSVQITSANAKYDSGLQTLKSIGNGTYSYIWNTVGLLESSDYVVLVKFKDPSNREVSDRRLKITIDNMPPTEGELKINNGQAEIDSRSVDLTLIAKGEPRGMFIDGDVIKDTNTFNWIPYAGRIIVNLTDTDGKKQVNVKFRDAAKNESAVTTASIILNRKAPTSTSIVIQDGAKYTTTRDVILKLKATNAEQMFIDGDVIDDATTFEFIPYKEQVPVKLSLGDGEKRIGVVFRSNLGIQSDRIQSTIKLDTTNPIILSVISQDSVDTQDNDRIYHPGQFIVISAIAKAGEDDLSGKIRIQSASIGYDSGEQKMERQNNEFKYTWDTRSLQDASDYNVQVEFTDAAGLKAGNTDLKIILSSLIPAPGQLIINNGEKTTESVFAKINISAVDVTSIFMGGDIINDINTFQWIPYQANLVVTLSGGDGQKTISVKFKNAAGNEGSAVTASITLDRRSPYDLGLIIANTAENAKSGQSDKFATSRKVFLGLSAKNATEIYINGDVTEAFNTFRWISYSPEMTVDLTEGDGRKVINAKFRNQRLIESNQIQSEIMLDTSPPKILSATVENTVDPKDTDGWYHPGESLRIIVESIDASDLEGVIRVKSESTGYDSGIQRIETKTRITQDTWRFEYIWDTKDLDEGNDYFAEITLTDSAGWSKTSDPLVIHIDNTPPANAKASINKGGKRTASRVITLEASADDAVEMFVSGDVRADTSTFQWIPLKTSMAVTLSSGDGEKNVSVKFRDKAKNETDPVTTNVILSESPPVIDKVDSWDTSDLSDNDEQYHAGELVELALKAKPLDNAPKTETAMLGTVSIVSSDGKYKSGDQKAREEDDGWYTYVWDTNKLVEGEYQVTWNLSDGVGHDVSDNSLRISIDNTPPKDPSISINNKADLTKSRIVTLNLQATGALWVFIDGDVLRDKGSTFEWIPFNTTVSVRLTDGEGIKRVQAKFKDNADNTTEIIAAQITLDTVGPDAVSVKIDDNAEYTSSTEVELTVLAEEAAMMYIDGDVSDNANVRKWITYQKEPIDLKLTEGDGEKSVSVEFQDTIGNHSKKISDSIIFDSTPPKIRSVKSYNSEDSRDDDGRYLEGTNVIIVVDASETKLSATIEINSSSSGYASGTQNMSDAGDGTYTYLWNTKFLQPATDYKSKIELKDKAGNSVTDDSLLMAIFDKPIEQKVSINNDDKVTTSQSVLVTFSADNASEMNISGDVMDDENTFEWIKFSESKQLNLTSGDGAKTIKVAFRDSQSLGLGESTASIKLDQAPPIITSVKTSQKAYRAGNSVEIDMQAGGQETGLKGTIQIRSFSTGYDSGIQKVIEKPGGEYTYLWDTTGLKEGEDYLVEAILSDEADWTSKNNSLIITIDNTPPEGGSFTINGGDQSTQKRSVKLKVISANNASEMFIEGDAVADSNTFQWILVKGELVVNLTVTDGEKKVAIRFRDEVGNETKPIENSIILNELPPVINAIASWDESNVSDSDNIYHAGQAIKIAIAYDNREEITTPNNAESQSQAWMRITSQKTGYDSGLLMATHEDPTTFTVVWKTNSVAESSDYVVEATLQDGFGQKTVDKSLTITIDNTPPIASELLIDEGKKTTNSQEATLSVTAKDAKEMFIDGDVVESLGTFRWIPFADTWKITLPKDNGTKNITVKLQDSANNVSDPISVSIVLDRSIPSSSSVSINGGAKYTDSYKITLGLSAKNAREMYVSGDIVQDDETFKWIPYDTELAARLTKSEGEKTVYARFRNGEGNESDEVSAQILLDITPPGIAKIESFDAFDNTDNDFNYHSGQKIVLRATASGDETGLKGLAHIQGSSDATLKYDSMQQSMTDSGMGQYTFLWDTEGMIEGNYSCKVILEDSANHSVLDKAEIVINNQEPYNPTIAINEEDSFVNSRTIEVTLGSEGSPSEVFIAGDIINDDTTFKWIPFSSDVDGKMKVTLNLRGADGKKKVTAIFRNKFRNESTTAETSISLELKRPELAGSCRIIQTGTDPIQAYLTLQFDEPISTIDTKNFFLTLKDKTKPQNTIQLGGIGSEAVLSNDMVMLEIPTEQFNQIKEWQPMTLASSYIQSEIAENSVFDMANKGNLGNKQKPADVYFAIPALSMDVTVDPPSFSPNGDGVKDRATILYAMAMASEVIIKIRDPQMDTIKEWHVEDQPGGVVYPVEWDGKKPDDSAYPDGSYTVIVMSKALEATGFAYGLKKELIIDNTAPQILETRPQEGAEISALFRVSVGVVDTPKSDGIGSVYVTIDNDAESKIPMVKSKTEGEYTIPTTSELLLPLGNHNVTFHVEDVAGNKTEKTVNYTVTPETKSILGLMNFPNPFSPGGTTTIRYSLPEKARSGEMVIYDAGGDMVFFKDLTVEELESGEHKLQWNGRDIFGIVMGRGVYFCRLSVTTETGHKVKESKIAIR
jgi:hypothetical protein